MIGTTGSGREHFADRLLAAIEKKDAPVCVGVDPRPDMLPEAFGGGIEALRRWCGEVLEIVAPYAAAVKPQIAYFEAWGGGEPFAGLAVYAEVVRLARRLGLLVIGDAKRNDIGSTAEAYAAAHLTGPAAVDAVTVNGYLGADGIRPFVDVARETGRGLFVLARTSNPSAAAIQDFADAGGKTLYEHMAGQIAELGAAEELVGASGYSCVGAVVGATYPAEARRLREIMPRQIFLVPGYGAQGATAADCAAAFHADGSGAIVNAARSVIYAHRREEYKGLRWQQAVEQAVRKFASDIARAVGRRE
jgi:orotidine-5'-phosphate decarboxylase